MYSAYLEVNIDITPPPLKYERRFLQTGTTSKPVTLPKISYTPAMDLHAQTSLGWHKTINACLPLIGIHVYSCMGNGTIGLLTLLDKEPIFWSITLRRYVSSYRREANWGLITRWVLHVSICRCMFNCTILATITPFSSLYVFFRAKNGTNDRRTHDDDVVCVGPVKLRSLSYPLYKWPLMNE